ILIKVAPNSPEDEKKKAKKKAEEILAQIKSGKPFELMALTYSQDSATNTKGGDLGFFAPGQMIKEFEQAAFSLKPGEVSGVVETKMGFHIIKVEEVKEEGTRPLEEVKEEIRERLLKERGQERMKNAVYRDYRLLLKTKDIKKFSENQGRSLVETKYFSREDTPFVLGEIGEFKEDIFQANFGEIIPPVYCDGNYYLIKILDKKKSYIPSLEEIKENIVAQLTKESQKKAAKQYGMELLQKIRQQGIDLKEIANQENLVIKETGFFSRMDTYIPKIGVSPEMSAVAFTLKPEAPFPDQIFEVEDKVYLIKLKAKEGATDKEGFWSKKERFVPKYVLEKSNRQFEAWLKNARAQAEIKFNPRATSP
ncbi:MAG: peptidylprolyl isomerase, partial [Desulfobacterota bacterium]|nr:peptidylprolyl isomerase [Thermodesulfobacteriota bacterium]